MPNRKGHIEKPVKEAILLAKGEKKKKKRKEKEKSADYDYHRSNIELITSLAQR